MTVCWLVTLDGSLSHSSWSLVGYKLTLPSGSSGHCGTCFSTLPWRGIGFPDLPGRSLPAEDRGSTGMVWVANQIWSVPKMTVRRKTDVFFWNSPPKIRFIDDLVGSIMESWNCSCGYLMFNKECVHPRPVGSWCGAVKGTYHVTSYDEGVLRWPEDTGYAPSVQLEKSWSHSNRTPEMHFLYLFCLGQLSILHQPWKYWNCQRVPLGDVMSLKISLESAGHENQTLFCKDLCGRSATTTAPL